MERFIKQIIKNKKYEPNEWGITQNHVLSLLGTIVYSDDIDEDGDSVWHYLARFGSYKILKKAINDYPEIKDIRSEGDVFIWHNLALSGSYEDLKMAINDYPEIKDVKDHDKASIWHYLALSGSYKDLKMAINDYPEIEDIRDIDETSIWHYLAWSGSYKDLKMAINDYPEIEDIEDIDETSIWHYLALSGSYKDLKMAINDYPEIKDIEDNMENSIWPYLIRSGSYEDIKMAIIDYPEIKYIDHPLFNTPMLNILKGWWSVDKYNNFITEINPKTEIEILYEKLKEKFGEIEVPENFICPISQSLILDPVTNEFGHIYDKSSLIKWYHFRKIDPKTNKKATGQIIDMYLIKSMIITFLTNYKNV